MTWNKTGCSKVGLDEVEWDKVAGKEKIADKEIQSCTTRIPRDGWFAYVRVML